MTPPKVIRHFRNTEVGPYSYIIFTLTDNGYTCMDRLVQRRGYPSAAKLMTHMKRTPAEHIHCKFQGCNWNYSSQDVYYLRRHDLDRHSSRKFVPMTTRRPLKFMSSVVSIQRLHTSHLHRHLHLLQIGSWTSGRINFSLTTVSWLFPIP